MKKQTLHLGWSEGEHMFISGRTIPLNGGRKPARSFRFCSVNSLLSLARGGSEGVFLHRLSSASRRVMDFRRRENSFVTSRVRLCVCVMRFYPKFKSLKWFCSSEPGRGASGPFAYSKHHGEKWDN